MTGKILLLMLIAAGMLAAQDTSSKPPEPETKPGDVPVTAAPTRKCSIPLINIRPPNTPRMPMIRPRTEFAPKRFFIEPPAPPCEEPQPNPLISRGAEKKDPPPAK